MTHSLLLLALTAVLAARPAIATQGGGESESGPQAAAPSETPAQETPTPQASGPPQSAEDAVQLDLSDLREQLLAVPPEDMNEHLTVWVSLVESAHGAWEQALVGPRDPSVSLPGLGVVRDALVDGLGVVAQVVTERGGDPAIAYATIGAIRTQELERSGEAFTVPASDVLAESLPVEILKASLRPLTKAEVETQLAGWIDLLRGKCLAVRNVEVAVLHSDSAEAIEDFTARAVGLRTQREHLIERVIVVIDSLEEKGGDVVEARAFVDSVVQTPPITGWLALLGTVRAWLTSAEGGGALIVTLIKVVATLLAAWLLSGILARLAKRGMGRIRKASDLLRSFVVTSIRRGVLALGLLAALAQFGVDMTPMLAAIGAAGLVIGLALQGTLSNFASGLLIMTNRPFDVGDLISTSGITGHVRGMTLLSTRMETLDSRTIYIPNNMVWGDTITNVTDNPNRRVDLVFGIGYDDDFKRAQKVLQELVVAHPKVLTDPEPTVRLHELADSSVNFVVRPWTRNEDYWDVYWDLTESVKERFDAEGISIPFPQRDVHLIPVSGGDVSVSEEIRPAPRPSQHPTPSTST